MIKDIYTIIENTFLAEGTYRMVFEGSTSEISRPGQFVNIELDSLYLRRPISVCDWDEDSLTLIYKTVGKGTEYMSNLKSGDKLDLLAGLGNGYDPEAGGRSPYLVGGGAGVPPLYGLAKRLIKCGAIPNVILGFNTDKEIFLVDEFEALGVNPVITTVDGSVGIRGFVTDAMPSAGVYVYACGPEAMLKAVWERASGGQFSFESRMGCGFGACMGCSIEMKSGYKRICKDGPVFAREEIIW